MITKDSPYIIDDGNLYQAPTKAIVGTVNVNLLPAPQLPKDTYFGIPQLPVITPALIKPLPVITNPIPKNPPAMINFNTGFVIPAITKPTFPTSLTMPSVLTSSTPKPSYVATVLQTMVPNIINTTIPAVAKITINTTVVDEYGDGFPLVNIAIDGKETAQTNVNGTVTIQNVNANSIVRVRYLGYAEVTAVASALPKRINLKPTAQQLNEVIIPAKPKPTAKADEVLVKPVVQEASMSWLLWILGIGVAYKGYQYLSKPKGLGCPTVKATI